FLEAISDHFRAIIVETKPINERALIWITKNARARIARLCLCRHCSNFNKRKSERFPCWQRDAIFIQTRRESAPMTQIQSERRNRRARVSRFWKQRSGGWQQREREVLRDCGAEGKKKRT